MTFDLRSAKIFLECVGRGSLGRAAQALNLTQPALTRTIRQLEDYYGVALFERHSQGVTLTHYGEALLPYAQILVSEADNAGNMIAQMKGASRGVVRVGGVGSVIESILMRAVSAMSPDHPDVQFHIHEELEDRLIESLKAGQIDLAILPETPTDSDISLAMPNVLKDSVRIYTRSQNPLLRAENLSIETLARQRWALPPANTPIHREWQSRFQAQTLEPPTPVILSRSVQAIRAAVLRDDILCWMPETLMKAETEHGTLMVVPVKAFDWTRRFRVYRRKKGLLPASTATLLQVIHHMNDRTF